MFILSKAMPEWERVVTEFAESALWNVVRCQASSRPGIALLSSQLMTRSGHHSFGGSSMSFDLVDDARKHPILRGAYYNLIETDMVGARSYEKN